MQTPLSNPLVENLIKQYTTSIRQHFTALDSFTCNLQQKVQSLLKHQQQQFIDSYRLHMARVSQQLNQMNTKLKQYERKIQYYENEGRLATYVQKVKQLQLEVTKLYKVVDNKNSIIKQLKQQLNVMKNTLKHSDEQIKTVLRKNIQLSQQKDKNHLEFKQIHINQHEAEQQTYNHIPNHNLSSIETFATEIPSPIDNNNTPTAKRYPTNKLRNVLSTEEQSQIFISQQSLIIDPIDETDSIKKQHKQKNTIKHLQQQLNTIKKQYNKLIAQKYQQTNGLSEVGELFWQTAQQLKRQHTKHHPHSHKTINPSTYQQFTKTDKLLLINTLLENEQTLMLIYQNLFNNNTKNSTITNKHHRAQSVLERSNNENFSVFSSTKDDNMEKIVGNYRQKQKQKAKINFPNIKIKVVALI